jgi:hypothetical protein
MLYIVTKNSLGCEINRVESDEDSINDDLLVMVRENIFAAGDTIEIVDAD